MVSLLKHLKTVWRRFLEILFPPICLNCRSYLRDTKEGEDLLCGGCFGSIKIYSNVFRPDTRFNLIAVSSYENTALKELIHYFKYNGFLAAKIPIEKLIIQWLTNNPNLVSSILDSRSLIVPIPLHKRRLRERGFNQAEIIAEILSRHLNLPLEDDLLRRIRETRPQIKMKNEEERQKNLRGSIVIEQEGEAVLSQYQNVILVDDVYTSGATAKEAVAAIQRAGIRNITVFAIAKT